MREKERGGIHVPYYFLHRYVVNRTGDDVKKKKKTGSRDSRKEEWGRRDNFVICGITLYKYSIISRAFCQVTRWLASAGINGPSEIFLEATG